MTGRVLFGVLILFGLLGICSGSDTFLRLNYGVMFKQTNKVVFASDSWLHTFEIELPDNVSTPLLPSCTSQNISCSMISQIITQLNGIRYETQTKLNLTLNTIKQLIPEKHIHKSRSKRALLPFIGKLSKGLFNTATMDDVNMLASHINKINRMNSKLAQALTQHEDHLSSYIAKSNDRMDNLMSGIKNNVLAIQYIQTELHTDKVNLENSFNYMLGILIDQIQASTSLNQELEEFKLGIISLLNGKLSPLLIPQDVMLSTIDDIKKLIQLKFPNFHLGISDIKGIYTNCKFLFARKDMKLYITLKLPISSYKNSMSFYDILSIPVPINSSSEHATQILDLPKYFIITSDQQYYAALTTFDFQLCAGDATKFCKQNIALSPITTQSCILALYANDKAQVKALCNFRFLQSAIKPSITELTPNSLLIYRTSLLSMECVHEHKMVQGCDFCIFKLPCKCSISTNEHYFAPRLASCHKHSSNISILHPVNLALLQHFFDNSYIEKIFADTTFQSPINVTLPSLKIYKHKMSDVIAADTKAHLSLSKMAEVAKNDEMIFQSLTEPLLENQIQLPTSFPDTGDIITLCSIGITIICLMLLIWTIYKVKKLAAALLLLQRIQQVKSASTNVPSFIYNSNSKIQSTSSTFSFDSLQLDWEHANFIILCLLCLLIILYILKKCYNRNTSKLYVEICSGTNCVFLDIYNLPMCPTHYDVNVPSSISDLAIKKDCFSRTLIVSWPNFTIRNKLTEQIKEIPTEIPISFLQARKLQKILSKPFFVFLYESHNGIFIPIRQ